MRGLVLSGGGARGAYQAGVLLGLAEIFYRHGVVNPYDIFTGTSAGAINACYMAAGSDDLARTADRLTKMWGNLRSDEVFKTDVVTIGKIGLKWMEELSLGGLTGASPGRSLLDTEPLWELIRSNCEFVKIGDNLQKNHFKALAITAIDYRSSVAITFVEDNLNAKMWRRSKRSAEKSIISVDHVMASSAIPILFPSIKVGESYFGDGCVRNIAPCSPAIHLGAQDLIVIGVRSKNAVIENRILTRPPSVARVINLLLNTILLDGVEIDVERMDRINEFLNRVPPEHHKDLNFKPVRCLFISPSEDIGAQANKMSNRMPRILRFMLKGLGPLEDAQELISYLLFEEEFTKWLIDLGHKDALSAEESVKAFYKT
jgi:NTE family protein